jgi:uncharacterized protein (TIGR03067 family)
MRTALLLAVFVALGPTAREEPADNAVKDAAALKGRWEIVSSEFEGRPATAAYRPGTVIVIEGEELYFTDGFAKSEATKFRLDARSKPRSIDIGGDKGKAMKGIYTLDKNSLKLCLNLEGKRPEEFKTEAGDKNNLLVLKRQEP